MIELDIEELFSGSMSDEKPVLREPYLAGAMLLLEEPEIESFTSVGIADRLVYRVGASIEISIEDFLLDGMNNTKPVLRSPVNAGGGREIPIGARPTFPGDNLHLLDFEEDYGRDLEPGIDRGLVLVGVTSRRAVLLGGMTDSELGFNSLGIIEFLVFGLHQDLLS
jgi:hypothetical protein